MNGWEQSGTWLLLGAALIIALAVGWRLSWLATRVDRAHTRAERTWAALDGALVRRAYRAGELAADPRLDPALALLVLDAAARALVDDLSQPEREQVESTLSHVLASWALPGLEVEQRRAALARRLHNDAVVSATYLRSRPAVRLFRLAGHATLPTAFEIADFDRRAVVRRDSPEIGSGPTRLRPVLGESRGTR